MSLYGQDEPDNNNPFPKLPMKNDGRNLVVLVRYMSELGIRRKSRNCLHFFSLTFLLILKTHKKLLDSKESVIRFQCDLHILLKRT